MHHAARGNDDTLSEQSRNRYIGGLPRRYVSYARVGEATVLAVAVEAARATKFPGYESRGRSAPTPHRLGVATAAATPGAEPQSFAAYSLTPNSAAVNMFKGQGI